MKEIKSQLGDLLRDFKEIVLSYEEIAFDAIKDIKQILVDKSFKDNVLLYRKVIRMDKDKKSLMISAIKLKSITLIDI